MNITIENLQLSYNVIYKRTRKTLQIKITAPNHLEITAPANISLKAIEQIIHNKSKWLLKHLAQFSYITSLPINKSITPGAKILYMGKPYTIKFIKTNHTHPVISINDEYIVIEHSYTTENDITKKIPLTLREWYKKSAHEILAQRTKYWATIIGVSPKRITIKDQKTRWGSASTLGNINYNWRIIMSPPKTLDYLVIHELCHLIIPNHSQKFWQEVYKFSPEYKQHRNWLQSNGKLLMGILN